MSRRRGMLIVLVVLAAFAGLASWALRHRDVEEPVLAGSLQPGSLEHGGRERHWQLYVPSLRAQAPALVIVLHGSMGDGAQARRGYGYDWDVLAEREGFVVAYPDGVEGHWNDCRRAGPYAAKRLQVDDVGFLRALVQRLVEEQGVDPARVFATGISNGGQMAMRLALEAPRLARAVAPVVASLPADGNMDCKPSGQPASVLLMNGTADPMNPWAGGDVALYGLFGNRGAVLSTEASVAYFRGLAGLAGAPELIELSDADPDDGSTVTVSRWAAPGKPTVALYAVRNGGHSVPHPRLALPRFIGLTNHDISAAGEIWRFFATAP